MMTRVWLDEPADDRLAEQGAMTKPTKLPRVVARLVAASERIAEAPPDRADFLHAVMCQVGMPRSRTAARLFDRASGAVKLRLEAGALFDGQRFVEQPLPYGPKPRLILVHMSSEAVRTRSREIEIGNSTAEFLRQLGLATEGRAYAMMRQQLMALAACRMTIGMAAGGRARTVNAQPIERFEAWLHPTGKQTVMWPGTLTLSHQFYNTMLEHAVPLDGRALAALAHSALGLDCYTWLAHRLHRVSAPGATLSWSNLRDQFGQEYADPRDFKRAFRIAMREALAVYPEARVDEIDGGLTLRPSPPPVAQRSALIHVKSPPLSS